MIETVSNTLDALVGWDWSTIIQALVSIWIATVATLALTTWKSQSKAQRQTDFLDDLTNSIHEFIDLMTGPIAMLKFAKIEIQSHVDPVQDDKRLKTPGAIAYIERKGEVSSKQLGELLDKIRPALSKINSCVAKGQVLGLRNYNECRNCCALITWQFDRIQAFSQVIGQTTLNWENPEVQEIVDKVLTLESDDVEKSIQEQNIKLLEFVRTNYEAIFR